MQQEEHYSQCMTEQWGDGKYVLQNYNHDLTTDRELQTLINQHDDLAVYQEEEEGMRKDINNEEVSQYLNANGEQIIKEEDGLYYSPSLEEDSQENYTVDLFRSQVGQKKQKKKLKNTLKANLNLHNSKASSKYFKFNLTPEQQYFQLHHMTKAEQMRYVQKKLAHYYQLKELIYKKPVMSESRVSLYNSTVKPITNKHFKETKQIYNYINKEKKSNLTVHMLDLLKPKFELYKAYVEGRYDPGYDMTLASIQYQFHLTSRTLTESLYNQWLRDPKMTNRVNMLVTNKYYRAPAKSPDIQPPFQKYIQPRRVDPQVPHQIIKNARAKYMRNYYCKILVNIKQKGKVYYIDECSSQRLFGSSYGTKNEEQMKFLLMGILGITGRASWKIVKWAEGKYSQLDDIKQLFDNLQQEQENGGAQIKLQKTYIILDPFLIKQSERIEQIEKKIGAKVMLMPQLKQNLNPMDLWFDEVKRRLRENTLRDLGRVLQMFVGINFGQYLEQIQNNQKKMTANKQDIRKFRQ